MYGLTLVTPPAAEPLSVEEAQAWLRLDPSVDAVLIEGLCRAARRKAERDYGRAFVTQTWRATFDFFPGYGGWEYLREVMPDPRTIVLPKAPLQAVTLVEYYDFAGVLQTLASTVYDVDATTDPGRLSLAQFQIWPIIRMRRGAVRIAFTAGYGAAADVPDPIKLALKMMVSQWYEHRGEDGATDKVPAAATALLQSEWNGALEYGL